MQTATINVFNSDGGQLHSWVVPMALFEQTLAEIARTELTALCRAELAPETGVDRCEFDVVTFGLRLGFEFR